MKDSLKDIKPHKGYVYKVFGTAKTFETEGDMYEYLTGHRSEVLDKRDINDRKI